MREPDEDGAASNARGVRRARGDEPAGSSADGFTDVDHWLSFDRSEELRERYDAARVLRPSGKKENRSRSEGDRSNSEGDRRKNLGSAAA